MKTFEEAFADVILHGEGEAPAGATIALEDRIARSSSLMEQIEKHPPLSLFMASVIANCTLTSALLTMFANGVMIGMEMEKAE